MGTKSEKEEPRQYIIYGETTESENNLIILSLQEANSALEAFTTWWKEAKKTEIADMLTSDEVRVVQRVGPICFFKAKR